jgi:hypothetical protein
MDHVQALTSLATEKYLLGELNATDREEFEEHFFGCKDCADDVRSGATFLEHSKVIFSKPDVEDAVALRPQPQPGRRVWTWNWAWGAVAALLVVVGYQNLVQMPRLQRVASFAANPYVMPAISLININSRGINQPVTVSSEGKPFLLYLDIPARAQYDSYLAELQDGTGKTLWTLPVSAEAAKNTLPIRVPENEVARGDYAVVVSGLAAGQSLAEIGRYPFKVQ